MIKEYDKIRLKSGERGNILEIFTDGTYLAEIMAANGKVRIDEIKRQDIKAVIEEIERAV